MTLIELAEFVCDKVGTPDADSVTICKKFLSRRYQLIWDSANWVDSMCMVTVDSSASHPYLLMPLDVGRVISIRDANDNALGVMDPMTLFSYRPEYWDTAGEVTGFTHVAPAVCGASSGAVDIPWYLTGYPTNHPEDVGYADFDITLEKVDGTVSQFKRFDIDSSAFNLGSFFWVLSASVSFVGLESTDVIILRESTDSGTIRVRFINPDGDSSASDNATSATYSPAPRRARVRLMKKPESAGSMLCLCKRVPTRFDEDHHVPQITDIENALICMAHGDMLQRQRQYTRAQQQLAEGQTHMRVRLDLERNQSASSLRIIPQVEPTSYHLPYSSKSHF